ncbi:MAG: DUF58 domain-containing protein [Candidatus Acetothermia bacterium]|jgi:uncharacterized protein (DUF58 family)|nr:DUF58 domain-containing protein [Candidatus Acetothermia bacterium]MDH7505135.1 DUF58 domain-containing protein [Candidatus Acetothermia bacterium]
MRGPRFLSSLGTLILLILLVGLLLRRGELLLLILPLLVYLSAGIWLGTSVEEVKLTAQRKISQRQLLSREEAIVRVEVLNEGKRRLSEVQLLDALPEGLTVLEGETRLVTSLGPGEQAALEYRVTAARGRFELFHLRARVGDSLGFNLIDLELPCPGEILFTPRFEELRDIAIAPRRTKVYSGVVKARLGGTGVEFFGTREYYQGDEFRWIDWNATARLGRLITAEFEQERVADVGLILDARARADITVGDESLFECSVQAAASLARYFIKGGNRVGLLIYGRYLDWTFPGYGRLQLLKLLKALTRAEKGDKAIFEGLENIHRRLFPAGSQIVLISRLLEQDIEVLRRLRAMYSVIVVSPDPLEFELARLPVKDETVELAWRIGRLRRELMLNKLREAGVRVVDWKASDPLKAAAREALSRLRR